MTNLIASIVALLICALVWWAYGHYGEPFVIGLVAGALLFECSHAGWTGRWFHYELLRDDGPTPSGGSEKP